MSHRVFFIALLFVGPLFLTGCFTIGNEFDYQKVDDLVLGEKPGSDYETMFGKPHTVRSRKDPDGEFKQVVYVYVVMYEGARLLTLEYKDDAVNGYFYISSFDEEMAQFNPASFDRVEIGQTKEEVKQLLGKPNGQALCPCYLKLYEEHCGFGNEIWLWNSISDEDKSSEAVSMFVIFDRKGVVINTLQEQVDIDN